MILVDGDVGAQAGLAMRRGLIAVFGKSGDDLGRGLIAGSIFAFGPVGRLAGLGMKRGSLVLLDPTLEFEPSPTFANSGRHRFPFLSIYLRELASFGLPVPVGLERATFSRYNGDLLERGQGEILCRPSDS